MKHIFFSIFIGFFLLNGWHCSPKVSPHEPTISKGNSKKKGKKNKAKKDIEPIPDAIGLNGQKLFVTVDSSAAFFQKEADLVTAKNNYNTVATLENTIWYGRRLAYLKRYQEAIDIYTMGIQQYPNSPELYRHRGHRYITLRQLDKAIADFQQAAALAKSRNIQVEKDGIPNAKNIPLSNLQFNIYYHWALAHYLKGEFKTALGLYQKCMDFSINSDLIVATADWLYMTYRRLGTDEKTAQWEALRFVNEGMNIIENSSYYERCLMYKGLRNMEDLLNLNQQELNTNQVDWITKGYGVGNWYFYNGNEEQADIIFNKILTTKNWAAFAYIAAEAELARLKNQEID